MALSAQSKGLDTRHIPVLTTRLLIHIVNWFVCPQCASGFSEQQSTGGFRRKVRSPIIGP